MKLHIPITKEKMNNHFHYSFWKYLLLVVVALVGWNLLFTTTRYRVPQERKLEFLVDCEYITQETDSAMQTRMEDIHRETLPQMEEVTFTALSSDDVYGDMQLTVWIAGGQGDVLLLREQRFHQLAQSGALLDLQPYLDSGALQAPDVKLDWGQAWDGESGELIQYGIPTDGMMALRQYGVLPQEKVLCVVAGRQKDQTAVAFLNAWIAGLLEKEALP